MNMLLVEYSTPGGESSLNSEEDNSLVRVLAVGDLGRPLTWIVSLWTAKNRYEI